MTLLVINDLEVTAQGSDGGSRILNGVDLTVPSGRLVGLIGETGAGKSVTGWSIVGLLEDPLRVVGGSINFRGRELLDLSDRQMRAVRGSEIGVIVQNPRGSLDPMRTIGAQMVAKYRTHRESSRNEARARAMATLAQVGMPDPERRMNAYPHTLSGGMAQRVLIAMGVLTEPQLLIADEPTTGLDVTVQAQILDLIKKASAATGSAVLLITHDLGVVAQYCDEVSVMFAGRVVESGPVMSVLSDPQHPYTRALVASTPEHSERSDIGSYAIAGMPPDLKNLPSGCHFVYRCPNAAELCAEPVPLVTCQPGHVALCHFPRGRPPHLESVKPVAGDVGED